MTLVKFFEWMSRIAQRAFTWMKLNYHFFNAHEKTKPLIKGHMQLKSEARKKSAVVI